MSEALYYQDGENFESRFAALISKFERLACEHSEDYADGIEDGYSITKQTLDMGGKLSTELFFNAERVRESHRAGIHGDIICSSYQAAGSIWYHDLKLEDLPEDVQAFLIESDIDAEEDDEYEVERQKEEMTEYFSQEHVKLSVNYKFSHTIFSDGTLTPHSNFAVFEGEDEYPLPEAKFYGNYQIHSIQAEQTSQSAAVEIEGIEIDSEFKLAFASLAQQITADLDQKKVFEMFYRNIQSSQFISDLQRLKRMENTVNDIFNKNLNSGEAA